MKKDYAIGATKELIRELCKLIDHGFTVDRSQFHDHCEKERFIEFLHETYKDKIKLNYLNKNLPLFESETLEFINNALGRHANVIDMESFGLKNNALLLGVNLCLEILSELDSMK